MVPRENTERLVDLLRDAGAEIQVRWQRTRHGLVREEVEETRRWLSQAVHGETTGIG
jgi:predicted esterase